MSGETAYKEALNDVIDRLFEEAAKRSWEWSQIATRAGLGYQTVVNLGTRQTKRPQFRTVQLIAYALGGSITFNKRHVERMAISWKPRQFYHHRKKRAA